jgi:nucleotide-binding universal stress UspA family protein
LFEKILLPLDGSHSCSRARELTAAIAKKFGSKITLMHVIYHDFMHPELKANYNLPPLVLAKLDETYREAGRKILKAAKDFFNEEHINVETILEKADDPADSILQNAKESNYDLIIMGNISEKNAYRYSLGSVAEKVSFHALCPVIITKRKTRISKLLVAYDSSAG